MIDLHCHVLPGIDDGPPTIEQSLALARAAAEAGVKTIVATPHVSREYPNDAGTIATAVQAVRTRLAEEDLQLEVLAGAELAPARAADLAPQELPGLTLGDGPWLLLECPFTQLLTGFDLLVVRLQGQGHRIVLAHPERSPLFHHDPRMLGALVRSGALASITAGSLVGRFGGQVQRFALQLVRDELVHNVASDAHDPTRRPPGMRDELLRAGLEPLAEWLTREVPAAILAGTEPPARPAVALPTHVSRKPWWRRLAKNRA